jgi:amino acid transporter
MSNVSVIQTERPRNVNAWQAASLLYGDWGTSKAYIIGLAFSLAAFSSFWLVLAVSVVNIIVGLNYIIICKYYPNGGGVYASVRHRSEILALLGAFFLICDYIITVAISALSAFSYLGVEMPEVWAMMVIAAISLLNYFGPRHTGNLALVIALLTFILVIILSILAIPFLGTAWQNTQPIQTHFEVTWVHFTGVIVALSGVESIANMTGVMKLDPGSTNANPKVTRSAAKAIIVVMLEVSFFTALFSLAINALQGLVITGDEVSAPGYPNVRDSMLRYMGESFCGTLFSSPWCQVFGLIISLIFGVLLLSAVNTGLIACSSLLFVMSRDGQLPAFFGTINRFGVPLWGLIVSGLAPIAVLLFVSDMLALASLYAIGFIGAIATNLGSTSTDSSLSLKRYERVFMFAVFLIMAAIEVTLFVEKSHARVFAITVIAFGLLLRGLVQENRKRGAVDLTFDTNSQNRISQEALTTQRSIKNIKIDEQDSEAVAQTEEKETHLHSGAILCCANHGGKTIEFALQRSKENKQKLYLLYIHEQKVIIQKNEEFSWLDNQNACETFDYAISYATEPSFTFLYSVSDAPALNIVELAKSLNVCCVIMGMSRRSKLLQLVRGNLVTQVFGSLPQEIDMIIVS